MDEAHRETEEIIKQIEKRISQEYAQAVKEVQAKLDDYLSRYKKKDETWRGWIEKAKDKQEKQAREEKYKKWRVSQIAVGKRWQELKETLAEDLHNSNEIARSIATGYMPEVYALNHNYGAYTVERDSMKDTSYTLYGRETVERIMRDDPDLLPPPGKAMTERINEAMAAGKDIRWNKQQIQSVMMQSLLQGDSIPEIARRLAEKVGDSDKAAAIRNARTMATGAQNAGRMDSYIRAQKMGIDVKVQWLAVHDNRTRHEHRLLDYQTVNVGEPFKVPDTEDEIRFPGDPTAAGYLVYNCRCTTRELVAGLEPRARNYADLDKIGSFEEWKKGKPVSNPIDLPERKAKAIKGAYIAQYRRMAGAVGGKSKENKGGGFDSGKLQKAMGQNYKEFNKIVNACPNKKLYNLYMEECRGFVHNKNGGFYAPGLDVVNFSYGTDRPGTSKYHSLAHECHHMFDKHIGNNGKLNFGEINKINDACRIGAGAAKIIKETPSQSDEFLTALRADMEKLKKAVNNKSIKREFLSTETQRNATRGIQDALDGFYSTQKNGILPWGHGDRYYNRGYNRMVKSFDKEKDLQSAFKELGFDASNQAKTKRLFRVYETASEAFANVGSAVTVGGDELEAMKKYMPETLAAYMNIIGGV